MPVVATKYERGQPEGRNPHAGRGDQAGFGPIRDPAGKGREKCLDDWLRDEDQAGSFRGETPDILQV